MSKENNLMLEIIKDMRDEQREHAKLSAAHREETVKWQSQSDHRTERIEEDLREHKEGVIQNRGVAAANTVRIKELEKPREAKKYLYKKYMKVGSILSVTLGVLVGLAKLFGLF